MSRGLQLVLAVLAAVLVAAGAAWFLRTHERVTETVDLPRTGEARVNPLFALQLALQQAGQPAQSRRRLALDRHPLAPGDTLLLFGDVRALTAEDSARLLAWVERGGHLVVRTSPPGVFAGEAAHPLWQALGVGLADGSECAGWQVAGESHHVEFCAGRRFTLAGTAARLRWGDAEAGWVYARIARGAGSVDVLADLDFLTTDKLADVPHVTLVRQVLAPNWGAGTVHLVYDPAVENLWLTLLRRHWPVWAPLLLALLAWLWMRAERFGPWLPAPGGERRSLLEHVAASGEFLYRYGYAHRLYGAAREAFLARLRQRDPEAAALTGAPQVARLAERFGLPPAALRDALDMPAPGDHAAFRTRIATLLRLRNQL